jgi:hypothetical protein
MIQETASLFKVLSDPSRLRIIASLNHEPMYVERLSKRLDLHPSTVSFHLKKLEQAGLVTSTKEQYYVMYHLQKEPLNIQLMKRIKEIGSYNQTEEDREEDYRQKIIHTFIKDGVLQSIPVQRKKRLVILQEIAKSFELNKEYPEKEVNHIISEYHYDFCTIRREFIMNKLFTRENGIYKRLK